MTAKTRAAAPPPPLSRGTAWTAERVARLDMTELRQLKDNALRLAEPEIAALCDNAMSQLRRDAAAARKARPPKPRKAPAKAPQD